tara:strand:- start:1097 stop:1285 length:189 start_codon:yes stop_codon:yes gene_type:complete
MQYLLNIGKGIINIMRITESELRLFIRQQLLLHEENQVDEIYEDDEGHDDGLEEAEGSPPAG